MPFDELSGGERDQRPYVEAGEAKPSLPSNGELLEQVLAETLAAADGHGHLHPEELAGLRQVAARYAGQPLCCDPMVIELVGAFLSVRFPSLKAHLARFERLAARIAETLWDDPESQQRLRSLWQHLVESEAV